MKTLSTSAFAKHLDIPSKELFSRFEKLGMITKIDGKWELTYEGEQKGGQYIESKRYGRYIAWPETLELPTAVVTHLHAQSSTITSTKIGLHFQLSSHRVNAVLSELGWIQKALKGWKITPQGIMQGGVQAEHPQTGVPFVKWPDTIVTSPTLSQTIAEMTGSQAEVTQASSGPPPLPTSSASESNFREKFPAKHRATDGHMVRSKAEMLIDNWLYMAEIVHAYERKLPVEEEVYCDFYIPTGKVYIEYWGYENDPKYSARKQVKLEIYRKYGFNLIELNDEQVQNLDDVLPRLLLKFGVQAY